MASKVEILGGQLDGSTLDNAASESTLKELVEAVKKLEKTTKDSKAGGATTKLAKPEIDTKDANDALDSFGKSMGKGAAAVAGGLGKLSGAALSAAGSVAKSLGQMGGLISTGNNNLSQFVGVLDALPGPLGKFASAVATGIAALEEMQQTQRELAKTGASFNNSMMEMRMTAARSGLSLSEFASVLKENAQSIGGLGDTITDGAKKMAEVGNAVGSSGLDEQFMKLGMSASDARKAAMKFSTELVKGDKVRGASANELASASLDYEKDLDLLAKQTGKSKDELRKFSEGMIKGGGAMTFAFAKMSPQMQAAMKGIMDGVGATMGQGAQDAMADVFSGAAAPSSEASAMFQSQMPGVVSTFKQMRDVASQVANTDEERAAKAAQLDSLKAQAASDQLKYLQSAQGQFMMQNKTKLSPAQRQFIEGLEAQAKSLSEQGIDINTASKADIERVMAAKRAEQERQAALDKGFNAFQATITKLFAAVQQAFFGALAPRLEKFAEKLQGIGQTLDDMGISVETITPVIGYIVDLLGITLVGAFELVADIAKHVYDGLQTLISPFMELFKSLGIIDDAVGGTTGTLETLTSVVMTVGVILKDILGGAIDALAVIIKGVVEGFTFLINLVKTGYNAFEELFGITGKLKSIFGEIPHFLRALFSKEAATAVVEGVKAMFNTMFGYLFSMLGNIPGLGKLGDIGKSMLQAAEENKEAVAENVTAANNQATARDQAVASEIAAKKQEVAAASANYKTAADAGRAEAAARKKRAAEDAEAAANKKNAASDLASADAMERSRAAAIKGMRERAGIETKQPAVAPSPGMPGGAPAGGAAPGTSGGPTPAMPAVTQDVQKNLEMVKASLIKQGITDPKMIAATLGNVMKETGGKTVEENLNYGKTDNTRIRSIFGARAAGKTDEELNAIKGDPSKMGEMMYGKDTKMGQSMGNTEAGDGFKYRGRGNIGLTGKSNYMAASKAIYGDDRLVKSPDMVNDPQVAADITAWYVKKGTGSMAAKLGIDTANMSQDQANQLVTSSVAGRAIKRGEGGYVGGELMNKVDAYAGSKQIASIAGTTATNNSTAYAAAKPGTVGGTAPTGSGAVAATAGMSEQEKLLAQNRDKLSPEQKALVDAKNNQTAQTAAAPAGNTMADVIASLNTNIAQLTMLQARAVSIAEQQLRATNGLSRDAYKAV